MYGMMAFPSVVAVALVDSRFIESDTVTVCHACPLMPLFDVCCPSCGWEASDRWESGAPTLCETCGTATEHVWRLRVSKARAFVDEWPMGKTFDNGFPKPRTFYSRSEYHKALAANGFEVRGDGEENFGWISAETLAKAAEMVTRVTSGSGRREAVESSAPIHDMTAREFVRLTKQADEVHRVGQDR